MISTITENIIKEFGYGDFIPADSNTGTIESVNADRFGQAIVCSIIPAFYHLNLEELPYSSLNSTLANNWVTVLFHQNEQTIIKNISDFTNKDEIDVESELNSVANKVFSESIAMVKDVPEDQKDEKIKEIFKEEYHSILKYIPKELEVGKVLNKETIDDNTNKMEGPISTLMHKIEKGFNTTETGE